MFFCEAVNTGVAFITGYINRKTEAKKFYSEGAEEKINASAETGWF